MNRSTVSTGSAIRSSGTRSAWVLTTCPTPGGVTISTKACRHTKPSNARTKISGPTIFPPASSNIEQRASMARCFFVLDLKENLRTQVFFSGRKPAGRAGSDDPQAQGRRPQA